MTVKSINEMSDDFIKKLLESKKIMTKKMAIEKGWIEKNPGDLYEKLKANWTLEVSLYELYISNPEYSKETAMLKTKELFESLSADQCVTIMEAFVCEKNRRATIKMTQP